MSKACYLIHGFATTKEDFASIIPFLKKRYDAIFLDNLPGHGENVDVSFFTTDNVFKYINEKFDEIKRQYDLVDVYGFSMGGALASYLGCNKDVNKVILFAPANAYINLKSIGTILKKDIGYTFKTEEGVNQEVFHINNRKSIDFMFRNLLPNYSILSIATFARIVRTCNKQLKPTDKKALLIRGDMDELVPDKASILLKSYYSNLEEHIIPDLGHLMLYSRKYRLIINEVKKFLDKPED